MQDRIQQLRNELFTAHREAYKQIEKKMREQPLKVEHLFDGAPEGAFSWEGDPDDVGNAYHCGDDECEVGWHEDCEYHSLGRDENGKTWYVVYQDSIAGCGDYQPIAGWDEREGDEPSEAVLLDLQYHFESRMVDHFYEWAVYNLDCAETGKDPLDQAFRGLTADEWIKSAERNLKYLQMRR
jgi:hypothetical protein